MGTRGYVGFKLKTGDLKGTYNHYDSYPSYLGAQLQKQLLNNTDFQNWGQLNGSAITLKLVDSQGTPTPEEEEKFADYWQNVDTGKNYYAYLCGLQGDLIKQLELGIMIDGGKFLEDSLFCEWGYVFDLEKKRVLILRGFNKSEAMQ